MMVLVMGDMVRDLFCFLKFLLIVFVEYFQLMDPQNTVVVSVEYFQSKYFSAKFFF